jgi:hypothetical protein
MREISLPPFATLQNACGPKKRCDKRLDIGSET